MLSINKKMVLGKKKVTIKLGFKLGILKFGNTSSMLENRKRRKILLMNLIWLAN